MTELGVRGPLVVISPHLDDAVFGCGQVLAAHPGSVVVTALAGRPARYESLTPWDAAAGFQPGDDPVARRREEDRAALAHLGARPVWLDFCDAQYGVTPATAALVAALAEAVAATGLPTALIPLGLFHSDHKLVHRAALQVMACAPQLAWFGYAEPNYRRVAGLLAARLAALRAAGISPERVWPVDADGTLEKQRAVLEYRSQLRALAAPGGPGFADVFQAEEFWRLRRAA